MYVPTPGHVFASVALVMKRALAQRSGCEQAPVLEAEVVGLLAAAGRLVCPECRRRGLSYRPFHKGGRHRAVASCPCGGAADL
jgi:hypothetical protein